MRKFKFDLSVVLKECERFGINVSDTPGEFTINGKDFDVLEKINNALEICGDEQYE